MRDHCRVLVIGDDVQPSETTIEELRKQLPDFVQIESVEHQPGRDFLARALAAERGAEVDIPPEWLPLLAQADVLVTHFYPVRATVLDAAPRLRLLATLRHGQENLDLTEAHARGIQVVNNPGREAEAVSDFTVGLIIDSLRGTSRASAVLAQGAWMEPSDVIGAARTLRSTVVGVFGYGHVGRLVARKVGAFGGEVLVADEYVDAETITNDGFTPVSPDDLLARSDVVTLHVRLAPGTRGLIGDAELRHMRPGAVLVNTARADLVDEQALLVALADGRLGHVALDVFWEEPLPANHPLRGNRRATLTPHIAGSTSDARRLSAQLLAKRLAEALTTLPDQKGAPQRAAATRH